MELVELTVFVPKGHEAAIAEMVKSQTAAIIAAATGTERADVLEARLLVAAEATKADPLPSTKDEAAAVLAEAAVKAEPVLEPEPDMKR